ncbi:MAG: hypothetical protein NUV73_03060 [Candidatus Daviesbacteria bacterium]|nr:hypothetical protein [Candidatus Daviesbacteria bacterium]
MRIFVWGLIIINIVLSAYWLLLGDIHYDVDVSRDFLVMDDIVKNLHFTLLGPRSGAISGVFHGPLWFYVNLPAFLIGEGNPLFVGWFWFFLSIVFLGVIFWVARRLFDQQTAILAVLLFSVNSIINPSIGLKNFYNPYGAVFLFPLFFFTFYKYITGLKVKYLIGSLFILGLIIQFQMAFGVPILLAATFFLGYFLFKKRKLKHLLSYFILLMPLSTFILFDLKHDGLQFKALMQFIFNKEGASVSFLNVFNDRISGIVLGSFDQLSPGKNLLTYLSAFFFVAGFISALKKSVYPKMIYFLFGYFFLGFWVISLFYSGGVGNYFWPFLPLIVIIFASFYKAIKKTIFIPVFIILYLVNLYAGAQAILEFNQNVNNRGPHSWAFNLQVAERIYQDAKGSFGYFNFSPDRFAYQQRYAMIYAQRKFPGITSFSSVKKPLTYLLEVDPPPGRPELNGTSWRISDVKIDRLPDQTFRFDFIVVEKYFLTAEETKVVPNPYLLDSVFLR